MRTFHLTLPLDVITCWIVVWLNTGGGEFRTRNARVEYCAYSFKSSTIWLTYPTVSTMWTFASFSSIPYDAFPNTLFVLLPHHINAFIFESHYPYVPFSSYRRSPEPAFLTLRLGKHRKICAWTPCTQSVRLRRARIGKKRVSEQCTLVRFFALKAALLKITAVNANTSRSCYAVVCESKRDCCEVHSEIIFSTRRRAEHYDSSFLNAAPF